MRRNIITAFMLLIAATMAFAGEMEMMTLKGVIIDNMCAGDQTMDELDKFVKVHTKECALAPACLASGYSIYSGHKRYKFDAQSSAKVAEFLQKADSDLTVIAEVKKAGEEVSLISIKNDAGSMGMGEEKGMMDEKHDMMGH